MRWVLLLFFFPFLQWQHCKFDVFSVTNYDITAELYRMVMYKPLPKCCAMLSCLTLTHFPQTNHGNVVDAVYFRNCVFVKVVQAQYD